MMSPLVAVGLAAVNIGLWASVMAVAVIDWRHYHDDRAARGVLLAMVLLAAAIGSLASAVGYYQVEMGYDPWFSALLASVGRGAVVVGGGAYVADLVRRHWDHTGKPG